MKNVYENVQEFYQELSDYNPRITRPLVEGYLRQKAWSGCNNETLEDIWIVLNAFIRYLTYEELSNLNEIGQEDYQNLLLWIIDDV